MAAVIAWMIAWAAVEAASDVGAAVAGVIVKKKRGKDTANENVEKWRLYL